MLVLSRRVDEILTITTPSGEYKIMVVRISGGQVHLGIQANEKFQVRRG
jgi:carbon storage regulator CsrA